jgi:hypothetical protein
MLRSKSLALARFGKFTGSSLLKVDVSLFRCAWGWNAQIPSMDGTQAVICTSGTTVQLYTITGYSTPTVAGFNYISNTSCSQISGNTVMTFTRPLVDANAPTLSTSSATYHLGAVGPVQTLVQQHNTNSKGAYQTALFDPNAPTASPTPAPSMSPTPSPTEVPTVPPTPTASPTKKNASKASISALIALALSLILSIILT